MKSPELGRPLAASLVFLALVAMGALALTAAWADLSSAEAERDAGTAFVSRALTARREPGGSAAPSDPEPLYLAAETETLAAARLDALLRTVANEAGGDVLSSRADVKHDEPETAGRIEVQAVIEAPNDALQLILLRIERGTPMMIVEDLVIQPVETAGQGAGSPPLRAALTLSAYWQAPRP